MLGFVIHNHPHRTGANLSGKLVRRFARHGSTFSGVGASDQPGAVQFANYRVRAFRVLIVHFLCAVIGNVKRDPL
jgi:hypothetical protein